ncbi:MAG: 2-dehydropantoate 2-reductase N-terminal domain-containing protein, partial [Anaerolineales bacterium]
MKKIAIFGAGAIGGLAGAYLVRSGFDVLFIDKDPWHIEAMKARGLYVHGNRGTFIVPIRHAIQPEE